jgi:hypothetical protein
LQVFFVLLGADCDRPATINCCCCGTRVVELAAGSDVSPALLLHLFPVAHVHTL